MEAAAELFESGCKIEDLHNPALVVVEAGAEDGGVAVVGLFTAGKALEKDGETAVAVTDTGVPEETAEHRITVEPGHTGPGNLGLPVDQGSEAAIPD